MLFDFDITSSFSLFFVDYILVPLYALGGIIIGFASWRYGIRYSSTIKWHIIDKKKFKNCCYIIGFNMLSLALGFLIAYLLTLILGGYYASDQQNVFTFVYLACLFVYTVLINIFFQFFALAFCILAGWSAISVISEKFL